MSACDTKEERTGRHTIHLKHAVPRAETIRHNGSSASAVRRNVMLQALVIN
jgi:hypothetical protein